VSREQACARGREPERARGRQSQRQRQSDRQTGQCVWGGKLRAGVKLQREVCVGVCACACVRACAGSLPDQSTYIYCLFDLSTLCSWGPPDCISEFAGGPNPQNAQSCSTALRVALALPVLPPSLVPVLPPSLVPVLPPSLPPSPPRSLPSGNNLPRSS